MDRPANVNVGLLGVTLDTVIAAFNSQWDIPLARSMGITSHSAGVYDYGVHRSMPLLHR